MRRLWLVLLAFLVAAGGAWYAHAAAPWVSGSSAYGSPACTPRAGSETPVGFLGDSITQDAAGGRTPAGVAALVLARRGVRISVINCGVPGSATADWLPGRRMFQRAVIAFHRAHVGIVHLMLG